MNYKITILFLSSIVITSFRSDQTVMFMKSKPSISFTFDDGVTNDFPGYTFEQWNNLILFSLKKEQLKAIFYVTGSNKTDEKGKRLLQSWNDSGHKIANHTFTHPNFNSTLNTVGIFKKELLQTDSIISGYSTYTKLFRFPYLKEGQNEFKVDSLRKILKENGYSNGYVTIDASDWFINSRLVQCIKKNQASIAQIQKYKSFYIEHIIDRAMFYEKLSYSLNGRHIDHTLLLHHNLTSALFLGDLITAFKDKGWTVKSAHDAFEDPIYNVNPNSKYAGESLTWSLAKQSGKYESVLRYPAEGKMYEEPKMKKLGL